MSPPASRAGDGGAGPGTPVPGQDSTSTAISEATSGRQLATLLGGARSVDDQLSRLESRLLAEAGGDLAGQEDVRQHLALVRAQFDTARIRQFLPILIEREVRRRLSGR